MHTRRGNNESIQYDQNEVMLAMASPFIEERCWPLCRPIPRSKPKMNSLSSVDGTSRVFGREREFANSIVCYG
jgi:hypothetical protein